MVPAFGSSVNDEATSGTPTDFYAHLCAHYDALFPLDRARAEFLLALTPGRHACLDLGCATGTLVESLAWEFKHLEGWDLYEGFLTQARHRCRNSHNIVFEPRNLMEVGQAHERYNLISCLGNTIVHLESQEQIGQFLSNARRKLKGDGALVLQTVNYDAFASAPPLLPRIERDAVVFERIYHPRDDGRLDFVTRLTTATGQTEAVSQLLPLRQMQLEELATKAGFSHVTFRGSFDRRAWSPKAPATIAILRR